LSRLGPKESWLALWLLSLLAEHRGCLLSAECGCGHATEKRRFFLAEGCRLLLSASSHDLLSMYVPVWILLELLVGSDLKTWLRLLGLHGHHVEHLEHLVAVMLVLRLNSDVVVDSCRSGFPLSSSLVDRLLLTIAKNFGNNFLPYSRTGPRSYG